MERLVRINGACGGYAHHNGAAGVLLQVEGGNAELAKDICMHIAAMRPAVVSKDDIDPAADRQGAGNSRRGHPRRGQAREDHRQDGGRPPAIIFTPNGAFLEQPFVKDDKRTSGAGRQGGGHEDHSFRPLGTPQGIAAMATDQPAAAATAAAWC